MAPKRVTRAVLGLVAMLALVNRAAAEDPKSLTDSEVAARLRFIQGTLDQGQKAANLWWYGWLIGYSGATAQQLAAHFRATSITQKEDTAVGYVTSAIGAIGQLVVPVEAGRFALRLRVKPEDTPEARRAKLAAAESYLRRSAAEEEFGRSWKMHAITAAINLGIGIFVWLHYDRPDTDGLGVFVLGQLVSEVQIFTQPMGAVRALHEYERADFAGAGAAADRPTWYVSATPGGFVVGCRF
jgi:hypothetical protein